jgi:hypothetical protein
MSKISYFGTYFSFENMFDMSVDSSILNYG